MNTSQREPEGDTAPLLTFNIEVHHHGKSARYCRASDCPRHAFCSADSRGAPDKRAVTPARNIKAIHASRIIGEQRD